LRKKNIRAAIIDLYNNERNEGMRCLRELVKEAGERFNNLDLSCDIFETRYKDEIPGLEYDIYISSGGPGSPFEGVGTIWEKKYFNLLDKIWTHNQNQDRKKFIFFVCHSFQMMARYFLFGDVTSRHAKSFGILPMHRTPDGDNDPILRDLTNPFYAADFRQFQVIQPSRKIIEELDARILSLEVLPPNADWERALMAVRISDEIVGTQFHPEADPASMRYHFRQPERKQQVVDQYGEEKYYEMLELLEQPDKIILTRNTVIPSFLNKAIMILN